MKETKIGFIGGGRVTRYMLKGWSLSKNFQANVRVYDTNHSIPGGLENIIPGRVSVADSLDEVAACDIVFLAIHPPVMAETLTALKPLLKPNAFLVSLAPKITFKMMENALEGISNLARANPNANGIIGKGVNAVAYASGTSDANRRNLDALLNLLGATQTVDEKKIEAYAVISAMGPTYFWFQIQHLKELAMQFGLEEKEAEDTIELMLHGAAQTLFHSGETPEAVMDLVPAKPMCEYEAETTARYDEKLRAIYAKIKPEGN